MSPDVESISLQECGAGIGSRNSSSSSSRFATISSESVLLSFMSSLEVKSARKMKDFPEPLLPMKVIKPGYLSAVGDLGLEKEFAVLGWIRHDVPSARRNRPLAMSNRTKQLETFCTCNFRETSTSK